MIPSRSVGRGYRGCVVWPERAPSRPIGVGGVKGHPALGGKRNFLCSHSARHCVPGKSCRACPVLTGWAGSFTRVRWRVREKEAELLICSLSYFQAMEVAVGSSSRKRASNILMNISKSSGSNCVPACLRSSATASRGENFLR